jgi:CHAT domain-containing protein
LLEAGVPGVIGTLWPVEELPTLLLTLRFYELWLGAGSAPATALHRAQHWLRTSAAAELAEYLHRSTGGSVRWPQTFTGRAAQARIFAHPDYWAAFAYTGV